MRTACLYLPEFAVQIERRMAPALHGRPVILGGYRHETGRVREASAEASDSGVEPGMLLRQAYQLCPSGVFLPCREGKYRETFDAVVAESAQLCPLVEPEPPMHILLGLRYERYKRRFADEIMAAIKEKTGFICSCGLASSRTAARIAAEYAGSSQVLELAGDMERQFLCNLPIERLPLSGAMKRRLRLFGMVNAGDLLLLPPGALEAQFGKEGRTILAIVHGEDNREVGPWKGLQNLVRSRNFHMPVGRGSELLEAAREQLGLLCDDLKARWQCSQCLTVSFVLEDGAIRQQELHFKKPTSTVDVLWRRLSSAIEQLMVGVPVDELRLTASGLCGDAGVQASFLDDAHRKITRLDETLGALQQRYGHDIVKRIVVRRGGRLPEERFALAPYELGQE